MATEEWVKRAIENSKTYEELPPRVRTLLPIAEWKAKYACYIDRPALTAKTKPADGLTSPALLKH